MKIFIYVSGVTTRLEYIFSLILNQLLGVEFEFVTDRDAYELYDGPKFAYTGEPIGGGMLFRSCNLLFENTISDQSPELMEYRGKPAFFRVSEENSVFPFDVFAASFYLVSRYEEYLPFTADRFGRFPVNESIASKGNFLHLPMVNIWTLMIREKLKASFPELTFARKRFRVQPTIDIDHAYAYQLRSFYRIIGGYGRSLKRLKLFEIFERTAVLFRLAKDPYDNYDYILKLHHGYRMKPVFFVLFAQYGGNDNNVSLRRKKFRSLLKHLAHHGEIGIHPSLSSSKKFSRLERELEGLATVVHKDIRKSRQHFLKFTLPKTYRTLISIGITDDYSMGYASKPGFRAGIADQFPFFDLSLNEKTKLTVHPVSLMDVTLHDYLRLNASEAKEVARNIITEIRNAGGEFVPLFHNESFSNRGKWKGWREVYEEILSYSRKREKE